MKNDIPRKICTKCGRLKPVTDFYENKYSPDGRYTFCKTCFDRLVSTTADQPSKKAKSSTTKGGSGPSGNDKDLSEKPATAEKTTSEKITPEKAVPKKAAPEKITPEKVVPEKTEKKLKGELSPTPAAPASGPAETFDFIDALIETETTRQALARAILKTPRQVTKIRMRRRICNGCGKTEDIDQVENNTVIPVHAWFCDICRQHSASRWVRKGTVVCDQWGREFKITKLISPELVMGRPLAAAGKSIPKSVKIYGSWKAVKFRTRQS